MIRPISITRSITLRNSEALKKYLAEIARLPMVTPDEEVRLALQIQRGGASGRRALETLVNANLRFVVTVAKNYQNQGLDLADLINEGNIGLIKAARMFDPSRGFRFITYAVNWISQSIQRAITGQGRMVRLPENQDKQLNEIKRRISEFEQDNDRRPTTEEIADIIGVDDGIVERLFSADAKSVSLEAPVGDDDRSLCDILSGANGDIIDEHIDEEMMTESLYALLHRLLSTRELSIVCACFGIGCRPKTLKEIGRQWGISYEGVRLIRNKSIEKLRACPDAWELTEYLA